MSASDYIDFLLAEELGRDDFDNHFGEDWLTKDEASDLLRNSARKALLRHGYDVGGKFDEVADAYLPWFLSNKAVIKEGDNYTGFYYKLRPSVKADVLRKYLEYHEIAARIRKLRPDALPRALSRLAEEGGWTVTIISEPPSEEEDPQSIAVPASDRIVQLGHNQSIELENAASNVIQLFEQENAVDGDVDLRERFLCQLRAGRELVRSTTVRAYLLYETVVRVLSALVSKYKDQAIGVVAKKLLDLLIARIFSI